MDNGIQAKPASRVKKILVGTYCNNCDYLIYISEIDEGCCVLYADNNVRCRICGSTKLYKIESIKVRMTCGKLRSTPD